ncbi:MAG: rhomboid family intramembrane serine protease [Acidobacteria bacterium]|nr:rhomboid family intramembrane serine protease [Acidobacteriota bacterium]
MLTALTSMFLHAGFWHIAGNLWFLYMFGRRVERSLGTPLFILLYLASGLAGTALHFALNRTSAIPCVGASGAISGILGCFFVLFPNASFDLEIYFGWWRLKRIRSNTLAAVGAWLVEQILLGLLSQAGLFATVAFWAHVGGFVLGVLSALILKSLIAGEAAKPFTGRAVMSKSDLARLDLR